MKGASTKRGRRVGLESAGKDMGQTRAEHATPKATPNNAQVPSPYSHPIARRAVGSQAYLRALFQSFSTSECAWDSSDSTFNPPMYSKYGVSPPETGRPFLRFVDINSLCYDMILAPWPVHYPGPRTAFPPVARNHNEAPREVYVHSNLPTRVPFTIPTTLTRHATSSTSPSIADHRPALPAPFVSLALTPPF